MTLAKTTAVNGANATVFVSVIPPEHEELTLHGLRHAASHLRTAVGRQVRMRRVPALAFKRDPSLKTQVQRTENELMRAYGVSRHTVRAAVQDLKSRGIVSSQQGQGSKVNHLSYVGDAEVGSGVNIGAGTITCNYDGANKHKTVIEDGAFIGSNSALVAPVTVGAGATVGAGSVISKDAPQDKLTLTRARQISLDWKRPTKK